MVLDIKDMIVNDGILDIVVRSMDTDVLVILLSFMTQFLELNENVKIWLDFGRGEGRRTYNLKQIFFGHGESLCFALPFFHTFTG